MALRTLCELMETIGDFRKTRGETSSKVTEQRSTALLTFSSRLRYRHIASSPDHARIGNGKRTVLLYGVGSVEIGLIIVEPSLKHFARSRTARLPPPPAASFHPFSSCGWEACIC
jgi:hypothetical protein